MPRLCRSSAPANFPQERARGTRHSELKQSIVFPVYPLWLSAASTAKRQAALRTQVMRRVTDKEQAMALRRIEEVDRRIANLQTHIQKLMEDGQPTIEAERLLQLMHQSRALMQRQADLFTKDKT
jgi:hypothetical protein